MNTVYLLERVNGTTCTLALCPGCADQVFDSMCSHDSYVADLTALPAEREDCQGDSIYCDHQD